MQSDRRTFVISSPESAGSASSSASRSIRKGEYRRPVLEEFGSLSDLTGTAAGSNPDGGGPFQFSGIGG